MTESTTDLSVDPCPLCRCRAATAVERIPYWSIWAELERQLGLTAPDELRERFTPSPSAVLFACSTCRLEYFSPHNQGDAAFYAFLTSAEAGYYTDRRWEYSVAEKRLHRGDSLLDIGCGDGVFLKRVAHRVKRAVGVDQNPDGIRKLADSGIEARCADLADFAAENEARFDVVCALQLIEHLPRVDAFADAARRCIAPGGLLLVSVPNNERLRVNPLDPLDCPPHHVSRWRPTQLREFARFLEFEFVEVVRQRRDLRSLAGFVPTLRTRLAPRHRSPGRGPTPERPEGAYDSRAPHLRSKLTFGHLRNLGFDHTMLLVARRPV
jgi:2-polyprenyl-3-methyl-5-hydroxy-6-metoxy-1,4-benzoquinol methylase